MENALNHGEGTQQEILIDQVQRLASQAVTGISATAANSVILAVALLSVMPKSRVLTWLFVTLFICLVRISVQLYYQKRPLSLENVHFRKSVYLAFLAASGCSWGSVPVFLFPYESLAHQLLIVFVLAGMVAGSVGVFASVVATYYVYCIPTIAPLIAILLCLQDGLHVSMAIMTTLFSFFMFMAARRLNREIYNFLVRKHENIGLIANLEREIIERQAAEKKLMVRNQQIESIVAERTAELRQVNAKLLMEIDERNEAEKALRESEEKFRELANSLPQVVFETNAQGTITFANRNAFELFGYTKDDLDNNISIFQFLSGQSEFVAKKRFDAILSGQRLDGYEYVAHTRDGLAFPVEIHATPVIKSNEYVGIRGIVIDLTDKKRAEQEQKALETHLQRAQKMEVIGTLAGGVAHDLNNILSGIVSYPDLLLRQTPKDSSLRRPLEVMQQSGKKAAAIVQDLLTLTRRGVVVDEVLNLNDVVRDYLKSPEHEKLLSFNPDVRLSVSFENNLPDISGSSVHLFKTVMNLISNAAEAMPKGGWIEVATASQYLDKPVKGYDDIEQGDYVVLTVSDNGLGISSQDIDRIFEPFFTKKKMGRSGTGLGMAVVWGTVKDHKGYIDVASVEGMGSKFSLYFPVTRKTRAVVLNEDPMLSCQGNGESVLLVDDVKEQREIASDMLVRLGYKVDVVSSGEAAVEYLRAHNVDVVVLDMIMEPGMDGLETYQKILRIHPGQKAVIASGFSETARVKEAIRLGAGPYIKKPYAWAKLGQAVKSLLNPDSLQKSDKSAFHGWSNSATGKADR